MAEPEIPDDHPTPPVEPPIHRGSDRSRNQRSDGDGDRFIAAQIDRATSDQMGMNGAMALMTGGSIAGEPR